MLVFALTHVKAASDGHMSHPGNGNIRVEFKFRNPSPEPITCIFYLEYDNSVRVDTSRTVTTHLKNGHDANIVYAERRELVLGSLPLRYVAALRHAIWHGHKQCRSSHRKLFTLANRTFSTKILECLLLRFVRYRTARPRHTSLHTTQLCRLGL